MQDIAAYYGTNWIQLWALNADIVNPDGELMEGSIVSTGHIYSVADGDVLDWVVRKFGSSREQILAHNYDVASSDMDRIGIGQPLCIIPNSCATHV
jgi:LysM repeat protein